MNKRSVHTYRSDTPSLLSLNTALTVARKNLPPHVSNLKKDFNEELALKLIQNMRTGYRKAFREMVKTNV